MHLLAAESGIVSDGSEPVDPNQNPADIVVLSAADTELACLAAANSASDRGSGFLRLAQLSWLKHPYSTDLYIDKTALGSRLVVIRALGGLSYWSYCLEQFAARLTETGISLAVLPGDDRPDDELFGLSSVSRRHWELLLGYFVEGGLENASNFLAFCRFLLDGRTEPPLPKPLLRCGCYWPDGKSTDPESFKSSWKDGGKVAAVVFYRALLQSGGTEPVDCLIEELQRNGINALPVYVTSLKDPLSAATLNRLFAASKPDLVINLTSFAVSSPGYASGSWQPTVLDRNGGVVLQAILASNDEDAWESSDSGLPARDIAMHLALPEVDGRVASRAIAFKSQSNWDAATQCPVTSHRPRRDRVKFTADLASNWLRLRSQLPSERRVAVLLANYPNKDGRIANGVGLDTPASAAETIKAMAAAGYDTGDAPDSSEAIMRELLAGPTNRTAKQGIQTGYCHLNLSDYLSQYGKLPVSVRERVESRWGAPKQDPFLRDQKFVVPAHIHGNLVIAIQPSRGYDIDPETSYHSPDLPPPHSYLAFYFWLRSEFRADAVIHLGKHGNLEWLPGKSVALSEDCFPEAALGPMPNIYPFIVNDPGEGTQAKRRSQAVIIDHLTPPLTRAETYGPLRELELMIDEYYEAAGMDPRRIEHLRSNILETMQSAQIDGDAGIESADDADSRLRKLDAYLCEIKESQIRDGLHILGISPDGQRERDLLVSLARISRGDGRCGNASILRALASDFRLGESFDPLDCDMAGEWRGNRPDELQSVCDDNWRSAGDTVERLEAFACALIEGNTDPPGPSSAAVIDQMRRELMPAVRSCGAGELESLLTALDGRFVLPGPSGAPSRGRPDVLPTGRNFYSVDSRSIPTPTAWSLGWKSASLLIDRHLQDHGDWPRTVTLTAWGTSNMRTGGDDIAQVLALMGVRPVWDAASNRVTGVEAIPQTVLGRPRIDVTLRVSGFFRDAFPHQMDLVAGAAKLVMELDEPPELNPAAENFRRDRKLVGDQRAGFRVFGSKPGAYGAGLQAMIDEQVWNDRRELGETYVEWGGYAYGGGQKGEAAHKDFRSRLSDTEIVVQNQDNREHDLLDSDDYYQFEGGAAAAVEHLRGERPVIYHNDHSRPERPVIRTLDEEIGRVVRSRVVNPKWIDGVKRHGYKGAFEMAATVDYMFAFAATTGAVKSHHFELVYTAYLNDDSIREFIAENNPPALAEIADRLNEAIQRGLWKPKLNSAHTHLARLLNSQLS